MYINSKVKTELSVLVLFSCLLLSCKKENDEKFPSNPDWLTAKISLMETGVYYTGTIVYAYKWNKEYFYLISIPLSSCMMCEFYSYNGAKFVWTKDNSADYQQNAKRLNIVWQRDII
jgi:hypothetical protein